MTTAKKSKFKNQFKKYTRSRNDEPSVPSQSDRYRCESIYLLSNSKRHSPQPSTARTEVPSWRRVQRDRRDEHGPDQYIVITEDYTKAGKTAPRLDSICCDVLREPNEQETGQLIAPSIRGTRLSICVEHTRFPLIGRISKNMGFQHVPEHRLWNVQWSDASPHMDLLKAMKRFQQINHFPGMSEICRKDLLSRNLNRMLKMYPGDYRIFPKTWLLPMDVYDVALYASKHRRTYILKPYSAGRGRGIWLTNDLSTVGKREKLICQTYIERPLLIDGFKFDLRVYTLITSVDPLRIFVYNEGLARFATQKYVQPTLGNSSNVYMHLTNYCLNRRNSQYDVGSGDDGGSKRKLSAFNRWLKEHNYDVAEFWASVDDAIIKTVISAWPVLRHNYHACFPRHDKIQASFQLLGFDILVDWKLKPYILEVNQTPSLSGDEIVDNEVKRPLIRDTLNLLSSVLVDKEKIIREDRAAMRERLLRQAWNRRKGIAMPQLPPSTEREGEHEMRQACSLGSLTQQIAWEESHLGNFRRVMPPTQSEKVNYYCKFYDQTKQIVMFADTASSRQREKMTRQQLQRLERSEPRGSIRGQLPASEATQFSKLNGDWIEQKLARLSPLLISARGQLKEKLDLSCHKLARKRVQEQEEQGRQQRALIAKRIREQKQLLMLQNGAKERLGIWQTLHKQNEPHRQANKRRKGRQKVQQQRLGSIELDAQGDKLFMDMHAVRQPAGLPGPPAQQFSRSQSCSLLVASKRKLQDSICSCTSCCQLRRRKPSTSLSSMRCKSQHSHFRHKLLNNWQPTPINETEEHQQREWRRLRADELEGWQFKEQLFSALYKTGHLSKNDIKKFPNLLYKILEDNVMTAKK